MTLESARSGLDHLATLRLWHDKNSIDGDLPVYANVKIGPIAIDGGGRHYTMFVRWATLRVTCEGFDLPPERPQYRRALKKDEAKAQAQRVQREETNSGWKAKVAARLGTQSLNVSGDAGGSRKKSASGTEKVEAAIELALVENLKDLTWRVGDVMLGDIRKLQGFLEGNYFSHDGEPHEPLCHLRARGAAGKRAVKATLSVSVQNGVHVVPDGGYASGPGIAAEERDGNFAAAFKDRLRSLALFSGLDARDQFVIAADSLIEPPPGEGEE